MTPRLRCRQRRVKPVSFGGENEIALRQTVNLVRPERDHDLAPREVNIGMMAFFFGESPDPVGEGEGVHKLMEPERFFEMLFVDDPPLVAESRGEVVECWSFQWRNTAPARNTFLGC